MEEITLIDDKLLEIDFYEEVQLKNKKYIKWAMLFGIVNSILFPISMTHITSMPLTEKIEIAVMSNTIGYPMLCFFIGLFLAIIPYRELSWAQKYKRASLLTLLALDIIFFIGILFIGLVNLYKYSIS